MTSGSRSDTHLAVLLPPGAARNLLRKRPGVFTIHQDAGDGTVLLFEEELLYDLVEDLKLRRKRKLSEEHRQKLATSNARYRFRPVSESEQVS